jgi:hypothetical protein
MAISRIEGSFLMIVLGAEVIELEQDIVACRDRNPAPP